MKMTKEQYAVWQPFFTEFWKTLKEYRNIEDESQWEVLYGKYSAICEKYGKKDKTIVMMILGFLDGLDKEWKKKDGIH